MPSDTHPTQGVPPQPSLANKNTNEDKNVGADSAVFGEGRFQLRVLFGTVVAGAIALVQSNLFRLLTREMDHWCGQPPAFFELSVEAWKQLAIPHDAHGNYSRCMVRNPPEGGASVQVVHCSEWDFNLSEYGNNVVSEWSLVCHCSYLKDIAASVNFVTAVVALPVIGAAADRIGRKTVTVVQLVALLLSLACSGLARDFSTFAATQAVVAATSRSNFVLYVILYEVTAPSRRILYTSAAAAFSAIFVPVFVFMLDNFKISWYWSLLIFAALSSVLLATFYFLEESPVWLLETHRTEQAEDAVVKAASVNALSPSKTRELFRKELLSMERSQHATTREHAASSIFAPVLRKRSVLLAFSWVVIAAVRGHYTEERGIQVNRYTRIGSSIGLIPMFIAILPFLQRGRFLKEVVAASTLLCSTACAFIFLHFDGELTSLGNVLMVIVRLSINVAVAILFYLSASLYPPRARGFGLGTCFAFAVIGNIGDFYLFSNALANREGIGLGIMAFLLALASVAVENLPSSAPGRFETRTIFLESARMKESLRQLDNYRQETQAKTVVRHESPTPGNSENRRLFLQPSPTQPSPSAKKRTKL
ncbi:hypothetical protein HPB48_000690 [Haemaphysalis longicornis]|uniref:Uncharacterized protein n=1 Tax=Haemaphysalis longicornis TaxID=44386 RepID=A0A9J6H1W2_HAELO|nr:hypothetical protein HPB48_000690 [Haemaphysalis longicornis]